MSPLEESLSFLKLSPEKNPFFFPFLVGEGDERSCFFLPKHPHIVLKISQKGKDKQTRREIKYFNFLLNKKVPFSHIPRFIKKYKQKDILAFCKSAFLMKMEKNP